MKTQLHIVFLFCLVLQVLSDNQPTAPDFNQNVQQLTEAAYYDLAEKLTPESNQIVFTMFFAQWCGHCKQFKQTWNALADYVASANKEENNILIVAFDVAQSSKLMQKFEIKQIPTLKVFYQGKQFLYDSPQRDLANLIKFANKNFLQIDSLNISKVLPLRPSLFQRIQDKFEFLFNKALQALMQNPIIILGGFICLILFIIAILLKKKVANNQILIEKIEKEIEEKEEDQDSQIENEEKEEKEKKKEVITDEAKQEKKHENVTKETQQEKKNK